MKHLGPGKEEKYTKQGKKQEGSKKAVLVRDEQKRDRSINRVRQAWVQWYVRH